MVYFHGISRRSDAIIDNGSLIYNTTSVERMMAASISSSLLWCKVFQYSLTQNQVSVRFIYHLCLLTVSAIISPQ